MTLRQAESDRMLDEALDRFAEDGGEFAWNDREHCYVVNVDDRVLLINPDDVDGRWVASVWDATSDSTDGHRIVVEYDDRVDAMTYALFEAMCVAQDDARYRDRVGRVNSIVVVERGSTLDRAGYTVERF